MLASSHQPSVTWLLREQARTGGGVDYSELLKGRVFRAFLAAYSVRCIFGGPGRSAVRKDRTYGFRLDARRSLVSIFTVSLGEDNGGRCRDRTYDIQLVRLTLYQLS
jgi:hypothetical protein